MKPKEVISTVPTSAKNQFKTPTVPISWLNEEIKPQVKGFQPHIDSFMRINNSVLPQYPRAICNEAKQRNVLDLTENSNDIEHNSIVLNNHSNRVNSREAVIENVLIVKPDLVNLQNVYGKENGNQSNESIVWTDYMS